jgi:hypothetical protein
MPPLTIFAVVTRAREVGRGDADRSARAAVADSFFVISAWAVQRLLAARW